MTEEVTEEEKPNAMEYPGVVLRYYRDHHWKGAAHIILSFATGGMWAVGWFAIGWFQFWAGARPKAQEYRKA